MPVHRKMLAAYPATSSSSTRSSIPLMKNTSCCSTGVAAVSILLPLTSRTSTNASSRSNSDRQDGRQMSLTPEASRRLNVRPTTDVNVGSWPRAVSCKHACIAVARTVAVENTRPLVHNHGFASIGQVLTILSRPGSLVADRAIVRLGGIYPSVACGRDWPGGARRDGRDHPKPDRLRACFDQGSGRTNCSPNLTLCAWN